MDRMTLCINKDNANIQLGTLIENENQLEIKAIDKETDNVKIYNIWIHNTRPYFVFNNIMVTVVKNKYTGYLLRVSIKDQAQLMYFSAFYNLMISKAIDGDIITKRTKQNLNFDIPTLVSDVFYAKLSTSLFEKDLNAPKTNISENVNGKQIPVDNPDTIKMLLEMKSKFLASIVVTYDSFRVTDKNINIRPRVVHMVYTKPPKREDLNEQERVKYANMLSESLNSHVDMIAKKLDTIETTMSKTQMRVLETAKVK